jgi:hypothetical protein
VLKSIIKMPDAVNNMIANKPANSAANKSSAPLASRPTTASSNETNAQSAVELMRQKQDYCHWYAREKARGEFDNSVINSVSDAADSCVVEVFLISQNALFRRGVLWCPVKIVF